jgi:hypothetical protein
MWLIEVYIQHTAYVVTTITLRFTAEHEADTYRQLMSARGHATSKTRPVAHGGKSI